MMGELLTPPRPVVCYVVPPQIELMRDALLGQQRVGRASRRQRACRVRLPVTLTYREQDEQPAAQPVEMFTRQVGQVVDRIVEVRRVAALAPRVPTARVVVPALTDCDREQVGPLEREVQRVKS